MALSIQEAAAVTYYSPPSIKGLLAAIAFGVIVAAMLAVAS